MKGESSFEDCGDMVGFWLAGVWVGGWLGFNIVLTCTQISKTCQRSHDKG